MKKASLVVVLLAFIAVAFAGIDEFYSFSASTGTYVPITGTVIDGVSGDDMLSTEIPIGFTFPFGDLTFTNLKVSSNGWVGLGTEAPHSNLSNDLGQTSTFPYIAPLWDDTSLTGGSAAYELSGTAPNRIFTIQYNNLRWSYSSDNQFNFQVKFYESGQISYHYGSFNGTPTNASASIGIMMPPGGTTWFYSLTLGATVTYSSTTSNNSISTWPGNGTIYSFSPVAPAANDLVGVSLTGNLTPSVGAATVYSFQIRNRGSSAQTNYTVKLLSGTGATLVSIPGNPIAAGEIQNYQINWTPATEGPITLIGKADLPGDENPQNDQSPPLSVTVMPQGLSVVTVGSGNETALMPVDMYYRNSLFQTLYYPDEVTTLGNISAIAFYNNFITNLPNMPTKVWLGSTTQENLSGGWILPTELTLVFDGTVNYPSGDNVIMIPLQTVYTYTGGNLVLYVQRPMDTQYYNFNDRFYCQTVGSNRSLRASSDGTTYDAANPPTGITPIGQFPKTSFYITPLSDDPLFMASPNPVAYGQVLMNSTHTRTVRLMNAGGGTLGINSVTYTGSEHFTMTGLPTLPQMLSTGQNVSFTMTYNPNVAGNHTGTITVVDNVARETHVIQVSGNSVDPTIYVLPHADSFDTVTQPNLPLGWSKVTPPGNSYVTVVTQTGTVFTPPNAVGMYNYSTMTDDILLVAPPLANDIATSELRIKFRARTGYGTYPIIVGMMTDYTNATTFVPIETLSCNETWVEHVVPLGAYQGTGRYVAFKHGNGTTYSYLYVDNYMIEISPTTDLAALSISGNSTPSQGNATMYSVAVKNWGSQAQSNYLVKLYNAQDQEVGSSPGIAAGPGEVVQVSVAWTPATTGNTYIYAKTILTGDQNTLNDQSPNFNVSVQPAGTLSVTVGEGNLQGRYPVDMFWRNSVFQTLYYPTELGLLGTINNLVFYNNFVTNLPNMPTKIYLGTTDQENLSAGWVPISQMTLVFDGTVNYPSGQNTIQIPLQTPFTYTNGNLVLLVHRPMDTGYYSSSDNFYTQVIGTNRSRSIQSDSTVFELNALPDGANLSGNFPKTTFMMTALSDDPVFLISPENRNFGTVLQNTTHNQTFTVVNAGGAPFTISSFNLTGSEFFSLHNVPTLPYTLNTGQSFQFVGRYNPTTTGNHTATITIVDDIVDTRSGARNSNRNRLTHTVALSGNAIDPTITELPHIQTFDAVTAPALPVTWSKIVQTVGTANVITSTNAPFNPPNSALLSSGSDTAPTLLLIAPPLDNSMAVNTMRTKFYARGGANFNLIVGVMTDPQNATTFTPIQTVPISATWTQYVVAFTAYQGAGRYIAFMHGGTSYRDIFIDDVLLEVTPQNDLAPLGITGNNTPSVGAPTTYTVSVFNWGTNPQADYLVKLYDQTNAEVASVPGTPVAANQTVNVQISWTPAVEGTGYIYAKTVLANDQNTLNDTSPNYNVVVQPQGLVTLTIGSGEQQARLPIEFYWRNSLSETIYTAQELSNTLGIIYGVAYYNNFPDALMNMPTKIWMGTTTQTGLDAGWIPSGDLQLVFDGTVNYPAGENTIQIALQTPFMYLDGQNLVIMVNRPMDTQYYSSMSYFQCQTIGTNRTRYQYSDSEEFNPQSPSGGTVTGQFPKTTFFIIPGGVGHINGSVRTATNQPLAGVAVNLVGSDYQAISNAQGNFTIQNIISDDYTITLSKHGYITHSQNIEIVEDETLDLEITLNQMPTVTVSGNILASDTGVGINGAAINLIGYENYSANSIATGAFTIPNVYANNTYTYTVIAPGYSTMTGTMDLGSTNHNMGDLIMGEVAYPPRNIVADLNTMQTIAEISWTAPDPNDLEVTEGFEMANFPPLDWSQFVTNSGPANAGGVYPAWCRFGSVTIGTSLVSPTEGSWQAGLWWSYEHQDEWLMTPNFSCPPAAYLTFDSYHFNGSTAGDHYAVKASLDGGTSWTTLWDASLQVGGWNYYASPVMIDLAQYSGQQIKLAWHAVDPPSNDGLWYVWFIDNIYVGNATDTVTFRWEEMDQVSTKGGSNFQLPSPTTHPSRAIETGISRSEPALPMAQAVAYDNRVLVGYKVWRLAAGQEANQAAWVPLTPDGITSPNYDDTGWSTLADGNYRWAVRSLYTSDVLSQAAFSNILQKETVTGMMSGIVRTQSNQPIPGAVITAGTYTATTNNSGAYTIIASTGIYDVTATATGYVTQTIEGVTVNPDQTTTVNFVLIAGSDADEHTTPVLATSLVGNYPNPFNPSTTIKYDLLESGNVKIDIYNTRGQLVKRLVNEAKAAGRHSIDWNGADETGNYVSSGVYYYKMLFGTYSSTRKMILMK